MVTPFPQMSRSTQRMIVGSLIGRYCALALDSGEDLRVEIRGLASPLPATGHRVFESLVLASRYETGDMIVVPIGAIALLEPRERPVSDPQHPDWEDPGRVVKALPKQRRSP